MAKYNGIIFFILTYLIHPPPLIEASGIDSSGISEKDETSQTTRKRDGLSLTLRKATA